MLARPALAALPPAAVGGARGNSLRACSAGGGGNSEQPEDAAPWQRGAKGAGQGIEEILTRASGDREKEA